MLSLQNRLNNLNVLELKSRLKLITGKPKANVKAEIIALLSNELLSSKLEKYWLCLDDLEQAAVAEAIYSYKNGEFNKQQFLAKYGVLPAYFISRSSNVDKQRVIALFFYHGFLAAELADACRNFVETPAKYQMPQYSNEDIKIYVKNLQKTFNEEHPDYQPELTLLSMETHAIHDFQAVLNLIDDGKILVSEKTKIAGSATTKKIAQILLGGDYFSDQDDWGLESYAGGAIAPIRAYAWPLLLQSSGLGLVRRVGTRLQLTAKGKKVSKSPTEETFRLLYQCWRDKGLLDEFHRINVVKGQSGRGQRLYPPVNRRLIIEKALKACPENEWIALDDFFRFLQVDNYDLRVVYDRWKVYISNSNYGCLAYSSCPFEVIQGRYILVYLFEYLATIGMIDVAYFPPYHVRDDYRRMQETNALYFFSRYDGLLFFRINPLGSYCLEQRDRYQQPQQNNSPLLVIDDSLNVILLRTATPTEKIILGQYLKPETDKTYQLDRNVLLQAIEQGGDLNSFVRFLNDVSEQPLAKSVQEIISILEERCNALSDAGNARLLNCSSVALAKMLTTDPNTGKYCFHAQGKLLIIPEKSDKAFQKAAKKLGYFIPKKSV